MRSVDKHSFYSHGAHGQGKRQQKILTQLIIQEHFDKYNNGGMQDDKQTKSTDSKVTWLGLEGRDGRIMNLIFGLSFVN